MRVCHVSPHLPPDQAANALLPAELGSWARGRGDEVTFVAHASSQGSPDTACLAGPVHWIARRVRTSGVRRTLRLDSWKTARAITAALDVAARDADLLHLHSNGLIVEVAANWAIRRRIPYVLTLYGTEIWHYRTRWPFDPFTRVYRRAAVVTFYSAGLLARAREVGLDRPAAVVIYPAVAPSFIALSEADRRATREALGIREPWVVLNVKRLHPLAGQEYLIRAFGSVARARSDARLIICGTGTLQADLQDLARQEGVANRVTFAGLVPNATVARYAAAADVFALPSLLEALPTVAVEALACGTPVVSADHPGGVELHGLFGDDVRVVPTKDVERLATALTQVLATPRRTLPETARSIEERFRPAAVDAAYRRAYDNARGRG